MQQKNLIRYSIIGIVVIILIVWIITSYNSMVKKQEKVKLQWSEIQNTYQRRLDLIPNIVNVVKGVSGFEQTTLLQITEARSKAMAGLTNDTISSDNYRKQQELQDSLAAAANKLIVVIEKYPVLKGTAAYAGLQVQLEGTERRIRVARNDFNGAIADYNRKVRSFPSSIIAGLFGFKKKQGFEAISGSDKPVEIKF